MKRIAVAALVCGLTVVGLHATPADTTSSLARGVELDNVVVYGAHSDFGVKSSQMSAVAVSKGQIMSVPVFLGEPDVLKALQKFPGVQSTGDGTAGIFVRGGDYDQNYITLDGSPLYNAEHMKGFVGAINPDVVQSVNFYRGAFPARYGSRLSSVIDVGIKPGDFEHYHGLLSVGMLSSRMQLEGPIWRGHTSLNVAARISYFDLIAKPVLKHFYDKPEDLQPYENMRYYDLNAKIVHRIDDVHRISAVFYYGKDKDDNSPTNSERSFSTLGNEYVPFEKQISQSENRSGHTTNNWHNLVSSLYWTANFSPTLRINANLSYSQYKYRLNYGNEYSIHVDDNVRDYYDDVEVSRFTYKNDISDLALTVDGSWVVNGRHHARGGFKLSRQELTPVTVIFKDVQSKKYNGSLNEKSPYRPDPEYIEHNERVDYTAGSTSHVSTAAIYLEDDWQLLQRVKLNYGLRFAGYFVTDKTYLSVEPRVALRLLVSEWASVKASYSRMSQGLHRLISGNLVMASDLWVPITDQIPLMHSNSYGVGVNCKLPLGLEMSVEGYYKTLDNVLEYRTGATFTMTDGDWKNMVVLGDGKSYGAELLLERRQGNTTGWLSYTWAKALRKFDRPGQEIDGGHEFYSAADRRHNFSVMVRQHFDLSAKWKLDLTAAWTYQTGRRGTVPSAYVMDYYLQEFEGKGTFGGEKYRNLFARFGYDVFNTLFGSSTFGGPEPTYTYKSRNDYKLPDVHHLDLTATATLHSKLGDTSLGLSLYNVYNHMNVSNAYVGYDNNKLVLKGICPFPFMPSLILTHKF